MRKVDPEARVVDYFATAPLAAAEAVLNVVKEMLKARQQADGDNAHQVVARSRRNRKQKELFQEAEQPVHPQ
jgi:hypothetical protein